MPFFLSKMEKNKFLDDTKAVSPVIGVVLMVAITVIMAAIIMNWSSGIAAPDIPKQVSVTVVRSDEFVGTITVSSIRPQGTTIQQLTVINETLVLTDSANVLDGFGNGTSSPGGSAISVGDTFTGALFGKFNEHITIVATFGDGTEAAIFDTNI